jgi:SpoVK/Ycf46/Vps4 family AAA+-type ATPase
MSEVMNADEIRQALLLPSACTPYLQRLSTNNIEMIADKCRHTLFRSLFKDTESFGASKSGLRCASEVETTTSSESFGFENEMQLLRQLFEYNDLLPSGIIISGPSSSGKTFLVMQLVEELKSTKGFASTFASCADFVHKEVGRSEKQIESVFKTASEKAPCLLVLDALDALFLNAGSSSGGGLYRVQAALRQSMDQYCKSVVVIATAADLTSLDASLLRNGRLEEQLTLTLPTQASIQTFAVHWLKTRCNDDLVLWKEMENRITEIIASWPTLRTSATSYGDAAALLRSLAMDFMECELVSNDGTAPEFSSRRFLLAMLERMM